MPILPAVALLLVALTARAEPPSGQALVDAASDAVKKCMVADASGTLDRCGSLPGNSPDVAAARSSVKRLDQERNVFMALCRTHLRTTDCELRAELSIERGESQALK